MPLSATPVGPHGVSTPAQTPLGGSPNPLRNSGTVAMTTGARGPDALSVTNASSAKPRSAAAFVAIGITVLGLAAAGAYLGFGRSKAAPAVAAEPASEPSAPATVAIPPVSSAPLVLPAPSAVETAVAAPPPTAEDAASAAQAHDSPSAAPVAKPKAPKSRTTGGAHESIDYGI
jgi:hypothetical protein